MLARAAKTQGQDQQISFQLLRKDNKKSHTQGLPWVALRLKPG